MRPIMSRRQRAEYSQSFQLMTHGSTFKPKPFMPHPPVDTVRGMHSKSQLRGGPITIMVILIVGKDIQADCTSIRSLAAIWQGLSSKLRAQRDLNQRLHAGSLFWLH